MNKKALKLRQYITEVAIYEMPLIKLLTALMEKYNNEIPEEATLGSIINSYIDKIENFEEKAENDTQENYDNVYEEFVKELDNVVLPIINAESDEKLS